MQNKTALDAREIFFVILIAVVAVVTFFIFRPYLYAILLGVIIAIAVEPVYTHLTRWLRGHTSISALITVFLVILIIAIPIGFFGWKIVEQAQGAYTSLSNTSSSFTIVEQIQNMLPHEFLARISPSAPQHVSAYLQGALESILQNLGSIFSGLVSILGDLFVAFLSLFFVLKHKTKIIYILKRISPLPDKYDTTIMQRMRNGINSVVRGSLAISLIQGITASIGFSLFGLPNAVLWGAFGALASFVPTIGTTLVTAPAVIYLFLTGNTLPAIGLAIWSITAVGLIDNALAPFLYDRGLNLHPLITLLAVLGGLSFFGPLGFILGPVIVALLMSLLETYASMHKQEPLM